MLRRTCLQTELTNQQCGLTQVDSRSRQQRKMSRPPGENFSSPPGPAGTCHGAASPRRDMQSCFRAPRLCEGWRWEELLSARQRQLLGMDGENLSLAFALERLTISTHGGTMTNQPCAEARRGA